ncbi:MAG: hypothetical protein AAB492_03860 [Patescibacteria group bacterium]
MSEQPTPQEVKYENPAVEAARGAVRKVLEGNDAFTKMRDKLSVKDKNLRISVYKKWMMATDAYIGQMTKADRDKLSTKLYRVKSSLVAAGVHASAGLIDTTIRIATWPGRVLGKTIGLGMIPFSGGTSIGVYGFFKGLDVVTKAGIVRTYEAQAAEKFMAKKIVGYKAKEAVVIAGSAVKNVGSITKGILEGFAYPDGKPKPPTFGEKIKNVFRKS